MRILQKPRKRKFVESVICVAVSNGKGLIVPSKHSKLACDRLAVR